MQQADGHAFSLRAQNAQAFLLHDLGPQPVACREPINVTSRSRDPDVQLISNFAHTPFVLDGVAYASVESFWQCLKYPEESRRLEIAPLYGDEARRAGFEARESATTLYRGVTIRVGAADHWRLMALACWSKFSQCEPAKQALLATGERPLVHKTRKDSRNIPGVVMADIWMKVRKGLVNRLGNPDKIDEIESDDEQ